jgi:hypothetical protein
VFVIRVGFFFVGAMTMRVVSTPSNELALTNCAYCSPSDMSRYRKPKYEDVMALVNGILVLTLRYPFTTLLASFVQWVQRSHTLLLDQTPLHSFDIGFGVAFQNSVYGCPPHDLGWAACAEVLEQIMRSWCWHHSCAVATCLACLQKGRDCCTGMIL